MIMPRSKRPLTDICERQCYRRVKNDPVSILFGSSQSRDSPDENSSDNESVVSAPVNDTTANEHSFRILNRSEGSNSCSAINSDHVVLSTTNPSQSSCSSVVDRNDPVQVDECCLSCLRCLCFDNCLICEHERDRCNHCEECKNGEILLDSDYDPAETDDEVEIPCPGLRGISVSEQTASTKDSNDTSYDKSEAKSKLANWAINNQIKQNALRELLHLLNSCYDADLPKDPRTVLRTPAKVPVRSCPPGLYWHAGLERGLCSLDLNNFHGVLEIEWSADGIPIARSSGSSFWPILCCVNNFDKVILIGAYHGNKKPGDSNDYLRDFVDEVKILHRDGLIVDGRRIPVCIKRLVADAQAKSLLCKTTGVSGYCSWSKCTVRGTYVMDRVVFLDLNAPLRTDESFRSMRQEEYHNGKTVLCEIEDFDMVEGVVLDWMHLVLLGIVRKMLHLFKGGKLGVSLQCSLINEINVLLEGMQNFIPNDFVRKTRSLDYLKQFKATELRLLILYVLPVAFTHLLEHGFVDRYRNCLVLHVALVVMASEYHLEHYGTEYSEQLCRAFVEGFLQLYGNEQASHNLHNLIHLPRDVANHGVLDKFSAFKFENYLQALKKMVRKAEKPLQQLARRYIEVEAVAAASPVRPELAEKGSCVFSGRPLSRCVLPQCGNPQYRCVKFTKFSLDASPANRYCGVLGGRIVEVHNIAYHKVMKEMVIVGRYFRTKVDFYDYPLPSSHLEIYRVSDLSREVGFWPVSSVCRKYLCIPFKQAFVVFPILHTLQKDGIA